MDISPPESCTPNPPPKSPSASSSDFEFTVSLSPTSSRKPAHLFCPADELFYKGQLLPLHLSPRLSMVRTLLLASSSSSSSSDATTAAASRDSTCSSADSTASFSASDLLLLPDCDSARPSSAAEDFFTYDDDFKKPKKFKYLPSLPKLSSVFARRESKNAAAAATTPAKRITATAKEVIRKYVKKVKPLYDRLASKQHPVSARTSTSVFSMMPPATSMATKSTVGFAMRRGM